MFFLKQVTPTRSSTSSPFRDPHPAFGLVPLKEGTMQDSAESTEYSTNQDELSPFKGRSEAFRGLPKWQTVPSEGSTVLCATEAERERNVT